MRKGNMKTLASIVIIASMMFSLGLGTMAYFNEVAKAQGNTFTAGYLDIKLHNGNSYVKGPITGFWSPPDDWAPGEIYTRRLYFRNDGNVDVQVVLVDFTNYRWISGHGSFYDKIEIISFMECKLPNTNYAPSMATWIGDPAPLTLKELIDNPNDVPGTVGYCDVILYEDPALPPHAEECDAIHKNLLGNTYLGPGEVGWLEITFKFSSDAGSEYEKAKCSFDLKLSFIQGPDSGICRCEMPGFNSGT